MNKFVKPVALLGLAGALAVGALAPQAEARDGRWVAGAAGFAAGAAIGAAAANSGYYNNGYYNSGYYDRGYYEPGYAYAPAYDSYAYDSYAYEPAYSTGYDSYAYEPAYNYRRYHRGPNRPNNSYTIKKRHLEGTE